MNDAHLWADAQTFPDLCELMARWLEGRIDYQPGYCASCPDSETEQLTPVLAAMNRSGLLTTGSQPGEIDGVWRQRAYVEGFVREERLAGALAVVGSRTDLVLMTYPPGEADLSARVPISAEGDRLNTWGGGALDAENIDHYYGPVCHPEGVQALHDSWQVAILDSRWGRNDLLWNEVEQALRE